MYRQYSLGARRDRALDELWIEVEGGIFNININRLGADVRNGPTGGNEGARRGDDLVPGADVEQEHADMQRRGAAVKGNAVLRAAKAGKIFFELRHVGTQAEGAVVERARNGGVDFFADWPHLGGKVEVRHGRWGRNLFFN